MSQWLKAPDSSYVNVAQLRRVWVAPDPAGDGSTWAILGVVDDSGTLRLRVGYKDQPSAQSALDAVMGLIGGSV